MKFTSYLYALLSLLAGVVVFLYFFQWEILNPANYEWLFYHNGDVFQNYIGGALFRREPWHFPIITQITSINYPEGVSIVYTDSNPLLSIITKALLSYLPPFYQYNGVWYLLCFMLMGYFSYRLIYVLTKNHLFALVSSVLFLLTPGLMHRAGHVNLMSHWLVVAAILVFVHPDTKWEVKSYQFWTLLFLSVAIHGYLFFMVFFIYIIWAIQLLRKEKWTLFTLNNILVQLCIGVLFVGWVYVLGYFYNTPSENGLNGFGDFSMNLNAWMNPVYNNVSFFVSSQYNLEQQYEGLNYLGLGVWGLYVITWFLIWKQLFKKETKWNSVYFFSCLVIVLIISLFEPITTTEMVFLFFMISMLLAIGVSVFHTQSAEFIYLYVLSMFMFVYAWSNKVYLGNTLIFEYDISPNSLWSNVCQKLRCSGRFYWISAYFFLTYILYYLYHTIYSKKILIAGILILCAFQWVDLHEHKINMIRNNAKTFRISPSVSEVMKGVNQIHFCDTFNMNLAKEGVLLDKKLNNFYMAHDLGAISKVRYQLQTEDFNAGRYKDSVLYVVKGIEAFPLHQEIIAWNYHREALLWNNKIKFQGLPLLTFKKDSCSIEKCLDSILSFSQIIIYKNGVTTANQKSIDNVLKTSLDTDSIYFALVEKQQLILEHNELPRGQNYRNKLGRSMVTLSREGILQIDGIEFVSKSQGLHLLTIDKRGLIRVYHW